MLVTLMVQACTVHRYWCTVIVTQQSVDGQAYVESGRWMGRPRWKAVGAQMESGR